MHECQNFKDEDNLLNLPQRSVVTNGWIKIKLT